MKFDKSRVYTAVNADELEIGSRCIFADTVKGLKTQMQSDNFTDSRNVLAFARLHNEGRDDLFVASDGFAYTYAYLIEPPADPKYKPFGSVEEAMKAIKAHGGWIKYNVSASYSLVIAYGSGSIYIKEKCIYMQDLLDDYVFADDGSPCGVLVEE